MVMILGDDNPTRTPPWLTWAVLAATVVVWLYQLSLGELREVLFILDWGAVPALLLEPLGQGDDPALRATRALATMVLHGGFAHLAGNMLYLWVFGDNVEDDLGRFRFVAIYVLSGLAAVLSHAAVDPASVVPMIGASGAISGLLGAYLVLHPRAPIRVLIRFTVIRVPAWMAIAAWFGLQALSATLEGAAGGGVAWFAHIGGFAAGMALTPLIAPAGTPLLEEWLHPSAALRGALRLVAVLALLAIAGLLATAISGTDPARLTQAAAEADFEKGKAAVDARALDAAGTAFARAAERGHRQAREALGVLRR